MWHELQNLCLVLTLRDIYRAGNVSKTTVGASEQMSEHTILISACSLTPAPHPQTSKSFTLYPTFF